MRYLLTILTLLTLHLTSTTALQNIILSALTPPGDFLAYSLAYFSDSDPCQDGLVQGPGFVGPFPSFCAGEWTILGHTGITFTGCNSADHFPSGVSDGGAPALTCRDEDLPKDLVCGDGTLNEGYVQSILRCS